MSSSRGAILCIEDEDELREDLAYELADAGFDVAEAPSGLEGLAALMAGRFDLVLCDVKLPGLGGLEVIERIRAGGNPNAMTPVILLTAFDDSELRARGGRLGIARYIVKPVDYAKLLELIAETLAR